MSARNFAEELRKLAVLPTPAAGTTAAGAPGSLNALNGLAAALDTHADGGLSNFLVSNGIDISNNANLMAALEDTPANAALREELAVHIHRNITTNRRVAQAFGAATSLPGMPAGVGGADLRRAFAAMGTPAVPTAAAATERALVDSAGLNNFIEHGNVANTHLNSHASASTRAAELGRGGANVVLTGEDIAARAFGPEYTRAAQEATRLYGGKGSSTTLGRLLHDVENKMKRHERQLDGPRLAEGTKARDRVVKDFTRNSRNDVRELVSQSGDAVAAHKNAARSLIEAHETFMENLDTAYETMRNRYSTDSTRLQQMEARYNQVTTAMDRALDRELQGHQKALDHLSGVVDSLKEAGVNVGKLEKMNFSVLDKQVFERAEGAATRGTESAAAHGADSAGAHAAESGGSKLPWVLGGAALGAFIANRMKGEDNDSRAPEVMGGIIGGIAGYGTKVWMGAKQQASAFPELAEKALPHLHI